eukprot:scaffold5731_cov119-Isochrysis_galbana.AAC.2
MARRRCCDRSPSPLRWRARAVQDELSPAARLLPCTLHRVWLFDCGHATTPWPRHTPPGGSTGPRPQPPLGRRGPPAPEPLVELGHGGMGGWLRMRRCSVIGRALLIGLLCLIERDRAQDDETTNP